MIGLLMQGCPDPDAPEGASGAGGQATNTAGASGASAGEGGQGGTSGAGGSDAGGASGAQGSLVPTCETPGKSCQRPIEFTPTVDFEGQPGQQGCAANSVCQVGANKNTGTCVLVGCTKPTGDAAVPADLNGSATCSAPYDLSFKGKASEIYKYTVSMSHPPPEGSGINAGLYMLFNTTKLEQRTDMEIGGVAHAAPSPAETRIFGLDAGKSGDYTLRGYSDPIGTDLCNTPITFTGKLVRLHDAAPNLTKEFAKPLQVGKSDKNTMGRDTDRWYVIELSAGQKIKISLAGEPIIPNTKALFSLRVLDAAENPLPNGTTGIGLGDPGANNTKEFTAESAGVYYIKLEHETIPLTAITTCYIDITAM